MLYWRFVKNNNTGDEPIMVELYDNKGNLVNSTTTDKNVFFEFVGWPPGVYIVKEVTSEGYSRDIRTFSVYVL